MLHAIRKQDGVLVEAWSQKNELGPFRCPACGDEVCLRQSKQGVDFFAHRGKPYCLRDLGESDVHRRCKAEIFACLKNSDRASHVELEKDLGMARADIYAEINGCPVAIEIQVSNLTVSEIARRTKEYTRLGLYVLWLLPWKPELNRERYVPTPWEKWLHAAYFGRVYYWAGKSLVIPYHFEPLHVTSKARTWIDAWGRQKRVLAFSRRSRRWKKPVKGLTIDILTDLNGYEREWWKGGDIEVPSSNLFGDFQAIASLKSK